MALLYGWAQAHIHPSGVLCGKKLVPNLQLASKHGDEVSKGLDFQHGLDWAHMLDNEHSTIDL
jgi:hypothetical protein